MQRAILHWIPLIPSDWWKLPRCQSPQNMFPICWDPRSSISLKKKTSELPAQLYFPAAFADLQIFLLILSLSRIVVAQLEHKISEVMFCQILITLCKLVIGNQNSHHWLYRCCWVGVLKLCEKYCVLPSREHLLKLNTHSSLRAAPPAPVGPQEMSGFSQPCRNKPQL